MRGRIVVTADALVGGREMLCFMLRMRHSHILTSGLNKLMLGMRLSILGLTERGLFLDYIHSCLIYTRENITHHVLGQIAMAYIPVAPMLGYASLFC